MKKLLAALALLCATAAHSQPSAPLLNVDWVDDAVAVSPERWAKASGAPTIWWRVIAAGMAFADGGLSLSPAGLYSCSRQSDVRLYRCDRADGESRSGSSYSIQLMRTPAVAKSPPGLPDGWIQSE